MKHLIIASAAALVLAAPLCASAETFTNGTQTNVGTTAIKGCLTSGSTDHTVTSGFNLSVQGSLQLVKSIAADGTLKMNSISGAGAVTGQADGSISISASKFTDTNNSWQHFSGTETSSTATAGSSAFNSISPQ